MRHKSFFLASRSRQVQASITLNTTHLQALIFDLDGTLVDSLADLATAVNRMLTDNGYPTCPVSHFPEFIGDGMKKLVERALPENARTSENIERCAQGYLERYEECWHDETRVYEGLGDVIIELKAAGVRLAMLSNKPHRFTQMCADHFFQPGTFEIVLGQRDHIPRKPDPTAGFEIADFMNLSPSQCAYVGDSGVDMIFGKAAGMRRIGVLWGFRSQDELAQAGAEWLIERPEDLLDIAVPKS
jgi:phosphoglycolate phosphatase